MSEQDKEKGLMTGRNVSRRELLKVAGAAGAVIGLGAGLGGLVAACGGEEETTTTTTAGGTNTTAGVTTTVVAGPEEGRAIKIGVLTPTTGPLASFAKPDQWIVDTVTNTLKDGVVCGDQKLHKFEFLVEDTQSSASRAAQVAGDLINNSSVDMILASSSPDNVNPAADQCEAFGVPLLANFVPWQPFFLGRQKDPANPKPFKWTWMYHFGLEDAAQVRMGMWDQIVTNKKVGLLSSPTTPTGSPGPTRRPASPPR